MPDERSRLEVVQALSEKLGPEVAAALMECVPPFPWNDISTKQHLDDRLSVVRSDVLAAIKEQSERTIKWTVVSVFGAIAAIGGAIAGVAALSS